MPLINSNLRSLNLRNENLMRSVFDQNLGYLKPSRWVWDTALPCPYQIRVSEFVGAWLAVPQTQRNHLIDFYWIIQSSFLNIFYYS